MKRSIALQYNVIQQECVTAVITLYIYIYSYNIACETSLLINRLSSLILLCCDPQVSDRNVDWEVYIHDVFFFSCSWAQYHMDLFRATVDPNVINRITLAFDLHYKYKPICDFLAGGLEEVEFHFDFCHICFFIQSYWTDQHQAVLCGSAQTSINTPHCGV